MEEGNRLEAVALANLLSITHTKNKARERGAADNGLGPRNFTACRTQPLARLPQAE